MADPGPELAGRRIAGIPLWRRLPIPAMALGAAVVAVLINLLAAGGIGIPTVALGLWALMALGLNLRDDRPCSRLREYESRVPPFVLSTVWAAVLGLFLGAVVPFWRSEAAISEAEEATVRRPPDFERAERPIYAPSRRIGTTSGPGWAMPTWS